MDNRVEFRKDVAHTNLLIKVGIICGRNAIRRSKSMDLVIAFIENGIVYEEQPNGERTQIDLVDKKPSTINFKRGMILHSKEDLIRKDLKVKF
jgi:hypothetical protein